MSRTSTLSTAGLLVLAAAAATLTCTAGPAAAEPAAPAITITDHTYAVGASITSPALGDLSVQRIYRKDIGQAPSTPVVVSFRNWDTAAVEQFVHDAASGTAITYVHEPEQEIHSGRLSAQTWADHAVDLAQIIQQEGRVGQVVPATILMRWTLDPRSHREDMLSTMLAPRVLDALRSADGVLGWDSYAGPRSDRTPQDMYGVAADWSTAHGLAWAIMETGSRVPSAARWVDTFAWLDAQPVKPRYFLAWNPPQLKGGVYAIQDQPAVAAVWRTEIALHTL